MRPMRRRREVWMKWMVQSPDGVSVPKWKSSSPTFAIPLLFGALCMRRGQCRLRIDEHLSWFIIGIKRRNQYSRSATCTTCVVQSVRTQWHGWRGQKKKLSCFYHLNIDLRRMQWLWWGWQPPPWLMKYRTYFNSFWCYMYRPCTIKTYHRMRTKINWAKSVLCLFLLIVL